MVPAPLRRPRLLATLGDPCGIGPELILASLTALHRWADVIVVGAKAGADLLEPTLAKRVRWRWGDLPHPAPQGWKGKAYGLQTAQGQAVDHHEMQGSALWLDPAPDLEARQFTLGQGMAESGRAAFEAVREGATLVMEGFADALVTLPLSKAAVHAAGHAIPGHTEFLQELSGSPITRMAFVSPSLCVALHTVHQSLRSVFDHLSPESVAETLSFAADRFIQLSGQLDLRVALCALNPHAGENGAFGCEEIQLKEAVALAQASFLDFNGSQGPFASVPSPFRPAFGSEGWELYPSRLLGLPAAIANRDIEIISGLDGTLPRKPAPQFSGPLPADSIFQRAVRGEFDLVVALYHDQGLIPMKVLEPSRSVNLTLGLPFVRTSPDHGTAYDKAGRWVADPVNFLEASALAVRLAGRAKGVDWHAEVGPGL